MGDTARLEDGRLLMGMGAYAGDVQRRGQLWLSVVRSPVAHGRLRGVQTAAAEAMPGVSAVLSAANLNARPIPEIPIRVVPRPGMERRLQPVIASERVRYVGEPIAVVVADDPYTAEDAAERVRADIDPLPPVVDVDQPQPTPLWDDDAGNEICSFQGIHGDPAIDELFAEAAVVVRGEFRTQRHTGLPMETRGLVAEWDDTTGELHLWGVTKFIHFTRRTVAGFFGVDPERVVCHRVDVGGMFGVRGEVYPEDFLVPWAAQVVGRPVGWIEDRREHLLTINHSRQQRHRVELAVAADGEFLAFRDDVAIDQGAYARPIGARLAQLVVESLPGPYHWRAYQAGSHSVATNKTPVGTMRGPSSFETTFVRERAIDIAARKLGMDPIALRRRNLLRRKELPFHMGLGEGMEEVVYDSGDYEAVLDGLLERVGYDRLTREVEQRRADGEAVGVNVAFFIDHSGGGKRESVDLHLQQDGRFILGTSTTEVGQGLATMATRVLSESLGVPVQDVEIDGGSSMAHGEGGGTFGSRSTIFVSNAARHGSELLRAEALRKAAAQWDVKPDAIHIGPDGLSWGDEQLHWKELAPIDVVGRHEMDEVTVGFGLHLAVVRVDRGTGEVRVERLAVAYDVGRAIDRDSVEQQLLGASVHGLGGALLEELAFDAEGQPLATTFMDYLIPTSAEVPHVEAHVFETAPAPGNPLGVKGAGEAGIIGVGAALANAAATALDLPAESLLSLPVTPASIRDALLVPTTPGGEPS